MNQSITSALPLPSSISLHLIWENYPHLLRLSHFTITFPPSKWEPLLSCDILYLLKTTQVSLFFYQLPPLYLCAHSWLNMIWYFLLLKITSKGRIALASATPSDHQWAGSYNHPILPPAIKPKWFPSTFLPMSFQSFEPWASTPTPATPTPRRRSASRPCRCSARRGPVSAHRRPHSPTASQCRAARRVAPAAGTTTSTTALPPRPPTLPATCPTLAPPPRAARRARVAPVPEVQAAPRWANKAAHWAWTGRPFSWFASNVSFRRRSTKGESMVVAPRTCWQTMRKPLFALLPFPVKYAYLLCVNFLVFSLFFF